MFLTVSCSASLLANPPFLHVAEFEIEQINHLIQFPVAFPIKPQSCYKMLLAFINGLHSNEIFHIDTVVYQLRMSNAENLRLG